MESMPPGHATAAFAYLSLYFNTPLKPLAAHNPACWKMLLFMAPTLGAILALAMT
jgi:membrane-associated PAP2 superfamily phosphatase